MPYLRLIEFKEVFLPRESLAEEDAWKIHGAYKSQVQLDWPSPVTGDRWRLQSQGWVGFLPLAEGRGILLEPKVPLRNLFAMLEYAFDLRLLQGDFECDSLPDFFDRFASLLLDKIMKRARTGFHKDFRLESDELAHIRGRMDLMALMSRPPMPRVLCEYGDQTMDVEENQILAWTLHTMLMSGFFTGPILERLRKADKMLRGSVSLRPFKGSDCLGRVYNRLNSDYQVMHLICRFFLDCVGPTHAQGDRKMIPFLVDMARLFETFVAKWLGENLDPSIYLKAQDYHSIGTGGALQLNPDMVLYDRISQRPVAVLDTKYKARGEISNSDYYQVIAYADALGCTKSFLIYPKELESSFNEQPGKIRVRSLVFDIGIDLRTGGTNFLDSLRQSELRT